MRWMNERRRRWVLAVAMSVALLAVVGVLFVSLAGDDSAQEPVVTPASVVVTPAPIVVASATPAATTASVAPAPTATPEPTPTATPEPAPTATPEPTPTAAPEPTTAATPEPTPTATPEPTPTATPEPTPTATPEPTPTATPEPTPTATPEPTPTATPEPTPTATPEPTPTATPDPSDLSWASEGSLTEVIHPSLIPLLGELVLAGRVAWHDPQWVWVDAWPRYSDLPRYEPLINSGRWANHRDFPGILVWQLETRTVAQLEWIAWESRAQEDGWEPAFPGAARTMGGPVILLGPNQGPEARDPAWVAHLGIELPQTILPGGVHPYVGHDSPFDVFSDDEIGFYPPLKPGVNVTYSANADIEDLTLRPECPVLARIELLENNWHWPRGRPMFGSDRGRAGYLAWNLTGPTYFGPGAPPSSGRAAVWLEDEQTWRWRQTVNTPYGWYTFDTSTLERRPVDTRPGSWDYFNLWLAPAVHGEGGPEGDTYSLSVGSGGRGILGIWGFLRLDRTASEEDQLAQAVRYYQFVAANPWPAFEPWYEILLPGQKQTRPTVHRAIEYETWTNVGSTYTGYLRLTCGDE